MMRKKDYEKILVISPYLPSLDESTLGLQLHSLIKTLSKSYKVFLVPYPTFQMPQSELDVTTFSLEKPIQDTFVSKIKEQLLKQYLFKLIIIVSHRLVKICLRELSLFYPLAGFVVYLPDLEGLADSRFNVSAYGCADLVLTANEEDKNSFQRKISFRSKVEVFSSEHSLKMLSTLGKIRLSEKKNLTSMIILTHNGLKYTKNCIRSLKKYTHLPYELIFVDNGSTDGTLKYFKALKAQSSRRDRRKLGLCSVRLIRNAQNLAYAKGNNQGMKIAKGNYILLLNNDVILTEGWQERMLACMESDKSIGLVGPCTNTAVGAQLIPGVGHFKNEKELQNFAKAFGLANSGTVTEVHRIIGFCMLIRREVINKVGLLDERFSPGGFEDYDYCLRVRQSGYRIVIAGDVFIYHVGGQGYTKVDYNKLREHNREVFVEKWCRKALEFLEGI